MKKLFITSFLFAMAMNMTAQVNTNELNKMDDNDVKEERNDSEKKTLSDLINDNDNPTMTGKITDHFADVWSRKSYMNLTYGKVDYKINQLPEGDTSGKEGIILKSDWAAAFNLGTQYNLHKPIANVATFNLDYSYVNLGLNHYAKEKGYEYKCKEQMYSTAEAHDYYNRPWLGEKYEASYGMSLGPSLTIAPFTYVDAHAVNAVHYVKFNVYYHVGYNASLAYMKVADACKHEKKNEGIDASSCFDFGHGLYTEFGFNISWKSIGIGYEKRTGKNTYTSFNDEKTFGNSKYKINNTMSRVYLQIRTGSKISKKKK